MMVYRSSRVVSCDTRTHAQSLINQLIRRLFPLYSRKVSRRINFPLPSALPPPIRRRHIGAACVIMIIIIITI